MREPCPCGAPDCRECGPLQGCDPDARECSRCDEWVSPATEHDCDAESAAELARLREANAECAGVGA